MLRFVLFTPVSKEGGNVGTGNRWAGDEAALAVDGGEITLSGSDLICLGGFSVMSVA